MEFLNLWLSYLGGLYAPLGAVCVLPLYPGFIAYLSGQLKENKKSNFLKLSLVVTSGIIVSMAIIGLIFTRLLSQSLTSAIGIISPIAFGLLFVAGILMILNIDLGGLIPKVNIKVLKRPYLTSFVLGIFFGTIVIPCNPASLIILFALSTTATEFIFNFLGFILFGLGMSTPLIVFSLLSKTKTQVIVNFITKNKRKISLVTGIIMVLISAYYLFFVFKII